MVKTRLEELFSELYSSSKRHDSWQRYAMLVELRNLMNQPKGSGSDQFERSGDDRRFGGGQFRGRADDDDETWIDRRFRDYLMLRNDDDDETWTWTETDLSMDEEHYSVMDDETESLEEESMPQFQVPVYDLEHGLRILNASSIVCEDSQYVVGCDELCDRQKSILQVSYVKDVEEVVNDTREPMPRISVNAEENTRAC